MKTGYRKLHEALNELGLGNIEEWEYRGTDDIKQKRLYKMWDIYFPNTRRPAKREECICGVEIYHNHYIQNINTKEIQIIGNKCIYQFNINTLNKCEVCNKPHKNRKNNKCKECIYQFKLKKCEVCNKPHRNRKNNKCNECRKGKCIDCDIDCGSYKRCYDCYTKIQDFI